MQKAAGILYTVGKVFNIISIVVVSFLILFSIAVLIDPQAFYNDFASNIPSEYGITTIEEFAAFTGGLLIVLIVDLVFEILMLVFGNMGKKALGNGEVKPQILVLVFAILSEGIFYLIASILGLVLASSNKNKTQVQTTEDNNANNA